MNILNLILEGSVFINLFMAIFVISQNSKYLNNRYFSLLSIFATVWAFSNYMAIANNSIHWLQSTYSLGIFVISTGLIWVLLITDHKIKISNIIIISLITLYLAISSYQDGFIVKEYTQIYKDAVFIGKPGWGLYIYTFTYFIIAFIVLWKLRPTKNNFPDIQKRKQLKYVFCGILITLTISAINSFIFPIFSFYSITESDNIGFIFFMISIGYTIIRHQLFNIKIITIQLAIFALWFIILVHILMIHDQHTRIEEFGLLLVSILLGSLIIRKSVCEMRQKNYSNQLEKDLQVAHIRIKQLEREGGNSTI